MTDRTKKAADLKPGNVVTRWPDPYHEDLVGRHGEWTIEKRTVEARSILVDHVDGRGLLGRWKLAPDTDVTVRVNARREMVEGLRALADLLERNTDVPVNDYDCVTLRHSLYDTEDGRAEIGRIAEVLKVPVAESPDGRSVTAQTTFGPVAYLASAFLPAGVKEAAS